MARGISSLTGPHKDKGEDGFLPAFLGTGMIPSVFAVLFGVQRGGLVIVPGHPRRVTFIDFQMRGVGGRVLSGEEGMRISFGWM